MTDWERKLDGWKPVLYYNFSLISTHSCNKLWYIIWALCYSITVQTVENVIILGNCTLAKINSSLQVLLLYSFSECPESFCRTATHDLHVTMLDCMVIFWTNLYGLIYFITLMCIVIHVWFKPLTPLISPHPIFKKIEAQFSASILHIICNCLFCQGWYGYLCQILCSKLLSNLTNLDLRHQAQCWAWLLVTA